MGTLGIMTLGKVLTLTRDAAQHEECVTDAASAARRGPERHTHTHTHFSIILISKFSHRPSYVTWQG